MICDIEFNHNKSDLKEALGIYKKDRTFIKEGLVNLGKYTYSCIKDNTKGSSLLMDIIALTASADNLNKMCYLLTHLEDYFAKRKDYLAFMANKDNELSFRILEYLGDDYKMNEFIPSVMSEETYNKESINYRPNYSNLKENILNLISIFEIKTERAKDLIKSIEKLENIKACRSEVIQAIVELAKDYNELYFGLSLYGLCINKTQNKTEKDED